MPFYVGFVGPRTDAWTEDTEYEAKEYMYTMLRLGFDIIQRKIVIPNYDMKDAYYVSGGCKDGGIDIWGKEIAKELGFPDDHIIEFKPDVEQWDDKIEGYNGNNPLGVDRGEVYGFCYEERRLKGYKSRNKLIAERSNYLFCLVPYMENGTCYHHDPTVEVHHPRNGGCYTYSYYTDTLHKPNSYLVIIQ